MSSNLAAQAHLVAFSPRRLAVLIALGITFWFLAALMVRVLGPYVFTDGNPYRWLMFVLAVPLSYGFMFSARGLVRLQRAELASAMAIMTLVATLCDGTALTCCHTLYGATYEIALFGAAVILWGAGVGMLVGYIASGAALPRLDEAPKG